jgi:hypothetical protein
VADDNLITVATDQLTTLAPSQNDPFVEAARIPGPTATPTANDTVQDQLSIDQQAMIEAARQPFTQQREQEDRILQSILDRAVETNADANAEQNAIARQLNLPSNLITNDLEEMRRRAAAQTALLNARAEDNPVLAQQLRNPEFAALAHDDTLNLSTIENLTRWARAVPGDIQTQFGKGYLQAGELGELASKAQMGIITVDEQARLDELTALRNEYGTAETWLGYTSEFVGQMAQTMPEALEFGAYTGMGYGTAVGIAGQLGPQILTPEEIVTVPAATITGFFAGFIAKQAETSFRLESGLAYLDMIDQGIDQDIAQYASTGVGLVNALLETTGMAVIAKPFKDALTKVVTRTIAEEVMTKATMSTAVRTFATNYAMVYGTEVTTEVLQEVSNIAGEEIARQFNSTEMESLLSTEEGREQIADRLAGIFEATTKGLILLSLPGPGVNFYVDRQAAKRAEAQTEFFENLNTAVTESRVRGRDPVQFRNFIEQQTAGTPAENIYLDAEQFQGVLRQLEVTPDQLAESSPSLAAALQEAQANGGDVVIKTSDYATNIAGSKMGEALQPHVRISPDAMSAQEAIDFQKNQQELFAEAQEIMDAQEQTNAQFVEEAKGIEANVQEQILAAGVQQYTPAVAKNYAQFVRDFAVVNAQKMGMSPKQFYDRYMMNIQGPATPAAQMQSKGTILSNAQQAGYQGDVVSEAQEYSTALEKFGEEGMTPEARIQRAQEQDFNTETTFYHWTGAPEFREFQPSTQGKYGPGIYLSDNPNYGEKYVRSGKPRRMPLFIRGNLAQKEDVNAAEGLARERMAAMEFEGSQFNNVFWDQIGKVLKERGFDGMQYEGETIVFDPKNVRSTEAAFDPDFVDSADILSQGELNRVANWSEQRIDALIQEYGYPGNRTKGFAVRMSPQQFLQLTMPEGRMQQLAEEAGPLDETKLTEQTQTPFLEVEIAEDGTATVVGHEGRHRMSALIDSGFGEVSIVLRVAYGGNMEANPISDLLLDPQVFSETLVAMGPGTSVTNAIPLNYQFKQDLLDAQTGSGIFYQRAKEQQEGKVVPETVDQLSNLAGAFEFAGSQQFGTNRQLKEALQDRVNTEAKKAGVDLSDFTANVEQYLIRSVVADALYALDENANAIGWYNEKVTKALRLVSLVHPEIQTDQDAKFAFTWALAVTSNGLKVDKNFQLAEMVYRRYKEDGVMPTDIQAGTAQIAINEGLGMFNDLVARYGMEPVIEFMTTKQTVKEVEAFTGKSVSGENKTTEVYGAAALGPKIGNGFFANLYGHFEQLTMDRWLMRTWGRWTGTLLFDFGAQQKTKRGQLKDLIRALSKEQKKAFEEIIGVKLQVGKADEVAVAINKASMKPAKRKQMAMVMADTDLAAIESIMGPAKKNQTRLSLGDELRKVGNSLAGYLDAQKEAPAGPVERARIRAVFNQALIELQQQYPDLTMSDLQALLWYPEKRLYDSAKSQDESQAGYADDEAPDYANAAAALAADLGINPEVIQQTITEVDNELSVQTDGQPGGTQRADGDGVFRQRARLDEATGLPINPDGTVTVYHHTNERAAELIARSGQLTSAGEPDVYVTTRSVPDTGYGDTAVAIRVRPEQLNLDDEFSNGRRDYRLSVGKPGGSIKVDVGEYSDLNAPGARGGFDPASLTSIFAESADLSTFLHETGHYFLTVYERMVNDQNAPTQVVEDMNTLLDWFGVKDLQTWNNMTLEQKREYHEQFAYSFEIYLFEGKSPNLQMQGLYERFAAYLRRVYKSIKEELNALYRQETGKDLAVMSTEVKQVMDRMLASEEQIATAEAQQQMLGLFQTQEQSGMTDEQWAEYQATLDEAHEAAVTDLTQASVRQLKWLGNARNRILKEQQQTVKAERSRVQEEESQKVQQMAVYKAMEFFKRGTMDGLDVEYKVKLSLELVAEMYGKDSPIFKAIKQKFGFGKYGMLGKENGMHPDQAAEMFGYDNGYALINDLLNARPMKEEITARTDERMMNEFSELSDPKAQENAVQAALHNEARARFTAIELKFLAKSQTPVRVMQAAARQVARSTLSAKTLKELRPRDYTLAAARAARMAQKAMKQGDTQAAVKHKRNEMLQSALAREAQEIRVELEKANKDFKKFFKADKKVTKTRNMDLVDAARSILSSYGIGPKSKSPLEFIEKLRKYNPDLFADLEPIIIDSAAQGKSLKDLTVDEFRTVRDQVEALWYQSKRDKQMLIEGQRVEIEEVVAALNERLDEIGMPEQLPGEQRAPSNKDRVVRSLHTVRAILRRVEHWADATDGPQAKGKGVGPFTRFIYRPVRDAITAYRVERTKYVKRYVDMVSKLDLKSGKVDAKELGYTFGYENGGLGKAEILGALLHAGNESNLRKLLLGRNWGRLNEDGTLDTSRWDAFTSRMFDEGIITKQDMDFVQAVWDLNEELKPMAQKAHHDVFGFYFNEVEAAPINTPFGVYRGGYVPAKTDAFLVRDAQRNQKMEELESDFRQSMPSTGMGFTKGRVEYNKPLSLDIRMMTKHIDDVIRFSMVQPAIKDVLKLLRNREFGDKLSLKDPVIIEEMLLPWLNRAATQRTLDPGMHRGVDKFWAAVRNRTGISIMFANFTNALQQLTGWFPAMLEVDGFRLRKSLMTYVSKPNKIANEVAELSPFMNDRMRNQIFDVQESLNELVLNPNAFKKAQQWSARHGYFMQQAFQNMVDTVVWTAKYNQVLEEMGATATDAAAQKEAIAQADATIRKTQDTLAAEDIARFQVGTGFYKTFMQFAGYFNMLANLNGDQYIKVIRDMGIKGNKGKLAKIYILGFMLPMVMSDAIVRTLGGQWDDDDDDGYLDEMAEWFFGSQLRGAVALVPGVGPGIMAVANAFNDKPYDDRMTTSPSISMLEASTVGVSKTVINVLDDDREVTGKNVRDVLTLLSLVTGIPLSVIGRPIAYEVDEERGRIDPTSDLDYIRGLATGKASEGSR